MWCVREACQVLVDEPHDHRALADRGGAALDRARADVAGGVDARDARLEQPVGAGVGAGEDEAVVVARDRVAEPVGARSGAEEEEQERERQPLAVVQRDRLELAVRRRAARRSRCGRGRRRRSARARAIR